MRVLAPIDVEEACEDREHVQVEPETTHVMESDGFWIGDPCDTFGGMNALVSSSKLKEDIYDEDDIDGTIAEEKRVTPLLARTGWREESYIIRRDDRSVD